MPLLEVGKLIDKMLGLFFGVFLGQKVRVSEEFQVGVCNGKVVLRDFMI